MRNGRPFIPLSLKFPSVDPYERPRTYTTLFKSISYVTALGWYYKFQKKIFVLVFLQEFFWCCIHLYWASSPYKFLRFPILPRESHLIFGKFEPTVLVMVLKLDWKYAAVFSFITMSLLLIVSLSAPTTKISFLTVRPYGQKEIRYGCFGYTDTKPSIGYRFVATNDGPTGALIQKLPMDFLTTCLLLHPITALLSLSAMVAAFFGLPEISQRFTFLVFVTTLLLWVVDFLYFWFVSYLYKSGQTPAEYGSAMVLMAAAAFTALLAYLLSPPPIVFVSEVMPSIVRQNANDAAQTCETTSF